MLSSISSDDVGNSISRDIKNLSTVAKLTKFRETNLAKSKKLNLANFKK